MRILGILLLAGLVTGSPYSEEHVDYFGENGSFEDLLLADDGDSSTDNLNSNNMRSAKDELESNELSVEVGLAGQNCWTSGCQLDSWAVVGCGQYGQQEKSREPCPGGNMYTCCDGENDIPVGNRDKAISEDEFNKACQLRGGSGGAEQYNLFTASLWAANIGDKFEAAKYLAHVVWETVGLTKIREDRCQKPQEVEGCRTDYGTGPNGAIYYGRGPLQLTHEGNYREASASIFPNDPNLLLNEPDLVASDSKIGWETAAFFWKRNVHDSSGTFGSTLKRINGALECIGGKEERYRLPRCDEYRQILGILGLPLPNRESDCDCNCDCRGK